MKHRILIAAGLLILVVQGHSFAGDLTPPGAPAPTMKTLSQVEARTPLAVSGSTPIVITVPGNYYLTRDVVGAVGTNGIEIAASGVRLDLNGFSVSGVPGSLDGVAWTGAGTGREITLENGRITGWGEGGVSLGGAESSLVRRVDASGNAIHGIEIGADSMVQSCTATGNNTSGTGAGIIALGTRSVVSGSVARGNSPSSTGAAVGIRTNGANCLVEDCTVGFHSAAGGTAHGILMSGSFSAVRDCFVAASIGDGTSAGIQVAVDSSVTGCRVYSTSVTNGTAYGIRVDTTGHAEGNHVIGVSSVTSLASAFGIAAADYCVVRGNTVQGIAVVGPLGVVAGIDVRSSNQVLDNSITTIFSGTPASAIRVGLTTSTFCAIVGNTITNSNPAGISIESTSGMNIVDRNVVRANTALAGNPSFYTTGTNFFY